MLGASTTGPQQISPPGETRQPSQAPGHKSLAAYALHFIHHLQGAAATVQSPFLIQEYLSFPSVFSDLATALYSGPFHCRQQPDIIFL